MSFNKNIPYSRSERVEQLLLQEIAQLLSQHAQDPRLKDVSITKVVVAKDFRRAKVFFTCQDESKAEEVAIALNKASGFVQKQIGSTIELRQTPKLKFIYDHVTQKEIRLKGLIDDAISKDDDSNC